LKKPLVFANLHKAKERGNTNLKSKVKPRDAWKSKGTRKVELGEGQGLTKRYLKRHQRSNRTKKSVEKRISTQAMKGVDE
jgi:hypothetical protein